MDIVSLPPEINREVIDSRYRLVIMAAQRAKAIAKGSKPTIATRAIKPTTVALEESLSGTLEILTGEEARTAKAEAKRAEQRRLAAEAERREEMGMDLSELEKDLQFYLHEKETKDRQAVEELFTPAEGEAAPPEEAAREEE